MSMAEGKTKFRLSYLILGFSIVAAVGSYAYGLWVTSQQEKNMLPRIALDPIVKALRAYHHQAGRFPSTFADLEGSVWHHKQMPNFGDAGRSLSMAHYYYAYYLAEPRTCTIWAIPVDRRREEASTLFVVLTPESIRRWKGPSLSPQDIRRVPSVPSQAQLAVLALTEQPPIDLRSSRLSPR
jgi:hypothetical protein